MNYCVILQKNFHKKKSNFFSFFVLICFHISLGSEHISLIFSQYHALQRVVWCCFIHLVLVYPHQLFEFIFVLKRHSNIYFLRGLFFTSTHIYFQKTSFSLQRKTLKNFIFFTIIWRFLSNFIFFHKIKIDFKTYLLRR